MQAQRKARVPMPQRLPSHFMLEKILLRLPDAHLQGQHPGCSAKKRLMEMSLHPQGMPMQKLLHKPKRALQHPGDRSYLFSLHQSSE